MGDAKTYSSRLAPSAALVPPPILPEFDLIIDGRIYPRPPRQRGPRHVAPYHFLVGLCFAKQLPASTVSDIYPLHFDNSSGCKRWSIRIRYGSTIESLQEIINLISRPSTILVVAAR